MRSMSKPLSLVSWQVTNYADDQSEPVLMRKQH